MRISDDTTPPPAERGRTTDGTTGGGRVNRQIRRLGVALHRAASSRCSCSSTTSRSSAPTSYNDNPATPATDRRATSAGRGARSSPPTASSLARSVEVGRRVRAPAASTPRASCSPTSPATSRSASAPTGVERTYNDELAGRDRRASSSSSFADLFVDDERTRRRHAHAAQRRAAGGPRRARRPAGRRSSPSTPATGAILALWSYPSLRPQPAVASHDLDAAATAAGAAQRRPRQAAAARAYRERYFPGSTFKVVTGVRRARAAARSRPTSPSTRVAASYVPPQTDATAPQLRRQHVRRRRCFEILRVSCNTAFARMGVDIGAEQHGRRRRGLRVQRAAADRPARRRPRRSSPSRVLRPRTCRALAQSAIGQNDVPATPLQMALVAAGDRQRRRDHDAPRHGRGPRRRRRASSTTLRARAVAAGRSAPRRPRPCARP